MIDLTNEEINLITMILSQASVTMPLNDCANVGELYKSIISKLLPSPPKEQ